MATVLIPLPSRDFDPTEAAVPWRLLRERGHTIVFATPDGAPGEADARMVTGRGLGPLAPFLRADAHGRSVLHGRRTTALPRSMEMTAWHLTRAWLGDYYRTYPATVQDEVNATLAQAADFEAGPCILARS
jgi:hypothetical protein